MTPFKEIECAVCHRLEFSETVKNCANCHWPLRPVELDEPAFGYELAIEIRVSYWETKVIEKHFQTPDEKMARRRAKRTPHFSRVLAIRPYSEENYLRAFGDRLTRM